jgi:hypothetical protein
VIVGQLIGDGLRIELTNGGQKAHIITSTTDVSPPFPLQSRKIVASNQQRSFDTTQADFTVCMYVRSDIELDGSFDEYDLAFRCVARPPAAAAVAMSPT